MRILIAPDKLKGCLTAPQAAAAIAEGLRHADPTATLDLCPLADGGEGLVHALLAALHGRLITRRVTGPLPEMQVDATFALLGDGSTAVIEMAAASGLALLQPHRYNPLHATTFGTGQLLLAAAQLGARHILLGIGGSATVDCGIGCAQAAGLPVLLADGETTHPSEPLTAADLHKVILVKSGRGSPIDSVSITAACDVTNPLFGPNGAAHVFAPQKGATPEMVELLDQEHRALATRLNKLDLAHHPGAGAAGGLGFGLLAFFGAELRSGIDLVLDAVRLRDRLKNVDLCITAEGRFDSQSLAGKTPIGVARLCRELGIPCIVLAGSVEPGLDYVSYGVTEAHAISDPSLSLQESMRMAPELLADTAFRILRSRLPRA